MTPIQSASGPEQVGPGHRVKTIPLVVHEASAASWGRPWRRRTLSLPAPQTLRFQGVTLPVRPLQSWLDLLSMAGMLIAHPSLESTGPRKTPVEPDAHLASESVIRHDAELSRPEMLEVIDCPVGAAIERTLSAGGPTDPAHHWNRPEADAVQAQATDETVEPAQLHATPPGLEPDAHAGLALALDQGNPVPRGTAVGDSPSLGEPPSQTASPAMALEPMIASLEDTLAVLAEASGVLDRDLNARHDPATFKPDVEASPTTPAAQSHWADGSNLEATSLQRILIQKESEMTEMHDVAPDAEVPGNTVPTISAELQEVAANLTAPQLEADPDDVLSDVQSTLNSLAGMAQGLTQQRQAAGRLQEELEEWNSQLQERERQASDKEERLLQLEEHLKQAKTNLDRMAAENNRLLAERSEALKELAQSVDLRDKTTIKRAEAIQLEQQRIDEQTASLRTRSTELDDRESALKRKNEELGVRLKQLQSAKDKFSTIVKSFNETVQFNSTLSAISKSVAE